MPPSSPGAVPRAEQSETAAAKHALRSAIGSGRLADPHRAASDAARLPRLVEACAGHAAVACYASLAPEPDTLALIEALSDAGVRVLLPVLRSAKEPTWAWFTSMTATTPGWRGIPQPCGPALPAAALTEVSFVWVSALAVTPAGVRLGTGGGWYDGALTHARPDAVIGTLVNDGEIHDALPTEPWDIPVDVIVTPSRTLRTGVRRPPAP